jgi:hypothetical protein
MAFVLGSLTSSLLKFHAPPPVPEIRVTVSGSQQEPQVHFSGLLAEIRCKNYFEELEEERILKRFCLDEHLFSEDCFVLSFGIANYWDFDDFMLAKGCTVWSFDPSMAPAPARGPKHQFFTVGIATDSTTKEVGTLYGGPKVVDVMSLEDIMENAGRTKIDLIRIDVEGSEWDVFRAWLSRGLLSRYDVNQLLVEIHTGWGVQDMTGLQKVQLLDDLRADAGLETFWSWRNHFNGNEVDFGKLKYTQVYELGFAKRHR